MATPSLPKLPGQIGAPGGAPADIRGVGQFLTQIVIALNAWISQAANLLNNLIIPAILNAAGTVKEIDTGVGLTGGPITDTGTIAIAATTVTPGTYTSADITVNQEGQLTAASNGGTGGTVTSVGSGTGLTGGPITTTGTLAIDTSVVPEYSGTLTASALVLGNGTNSLHVSTNWTQDGSANLAGNFNAAAGPAMISGVSGLHVLGTDGTSSGGIVLDNANVNAVIDARTTQGTLASPTANTSGQVLLAINVMGYDSSALTNRRGQISAQTASAWTTGSTATSFKISTTPIGSATMAQTTRFQSDGTLYVGATNSETTPNTGAGTVNVDTGYFRGGASSPTNIQTGKAATQKTTASPGTVTATSPTYKMLGFAGTITPKWNGVALVIFTGSCSTGMLSDVATLVLSYGTGTAPTNGAALAGTQVGSVYTFNPAVAGFSIAAVITGLSAGTPYWLDLAVGSLGGYAVTFLSTGCSAIEP